MNNGKRKTFRILAAGAVALAVAGGAPVAGAAEAGWIAGTTPSQRPAGAPIKGETVKDAQWFQVALTGVQPPYPESLRFLEDQGDWWTPFTRPGMTGPYDLREWHGSRQAAMSPMQFWLQRSQPPVHFGVYQLGMAPWMGMGPMMNRPQAMYPVPQAMYPMMPGMVPNWMLWRSF